jgi:hypothetical protein
MTNKKALQIVEKLAKLANAQGLIVDVDQVEAIEYMDSIIASMDSFVAEDEDDDEGADITPGTRAELDKLWGGDNE